MSYASERRFLGRMIRASWMALAFGDLMAATYLLAHGATFWTSLPVILATAGATFAAFVIAPEMTAMIASADEKLHASSLS